MPRTPVIFGQMSQCRGKIKTREMSRFVSEISDVYKPHGVTTICFRMFSRMIIVEHEAFCNAVRVAKLASKLNLASWKKPNANTVHPRKQTMEPEKGRPQKEKEKTRHPLQTTNFGGSKCYFSGVYALNQGSAAERLRWIMAQFFFPK